MSSLRFRPIVVALFLSTLLPLPAATAAGGDQQPPRQIAEPAELTLEELLNIKVTTATKTSERVRDVPARVEVVTAEQIERRGYRSLTDVLRDLPDFKVELGTDPDWPVDVTVSGTRGAGRIVLLLDGIRISAPTGEPLPILANYPVHSARQIEIVYGPGSALYGADAFSAVVNIITKDSDEAPGLTATNSNGQFGLSNTAVSYAATIGGVAKLMVAGQALYDRQPDLSRYYPTDFRGLQAQRSGTFDTIFGSMTPAGAVPATFASPLSARSLQATLQLGRLQLMLFQNAAKTPTAPDYNPDNTIYSGEAFNRNTLTVAAGIYTRQFGRLTSTSTVMTSRHQLDPASGYRNVYSSMERSYKYAYGSMAKAEEQLSWKPVRDLTITTGGTVERFFSIPKGADLNTPVQSRDVPGTILGTNIPDDFFKLRYVNLGAYVQMQYAITHVLTATVGARADHNSRYGGTFNPRAGLVWQPTFKSSVKLLYGTAFLAPTPFEAYSHYGSFFSSDGGQTYTSGFWHLPNPDLKPQFERTTELTVRHSATPAIEVWGSSFYSHFSNLIRLEGASGADLYAGTYKGWPVDFIEISVNEGTQRTYGVSTGVDVAHSLGANRLITGRASLSLVDGQVQDHSSNVALQIGGMAPVQGRMSADLQWDRWSFSPRLLLTGKQRVLATTVTADEQRRRLTLNGFAQLDVNIRRQHLFRNVGAFVTIENALDQRYRNIDLRAYTNPEELLGSPQNPRRVTAGFDVRIP